MLATARSALPRPVRHLTSFAVRGLFSAARLCGFDRHLLRVRFGAWAPRWIGGRTIVRWRDVTVEIDPGEAHGFHVFVHGDYGGAETDACIELCRHASVFVDVGAHIGLITLAVARACPRLQVVAVEADPDVSAWLRRNLALNPNLASRVTILEAAAADRDGEVPFAPGTGPENVGTGHVTTETNRARRLPAIALGPWLAARGLAADVVKIDVEGGERSVLAGLWAAGTPPAAIMIETHGYMFEPTEQFNGQVLDELHGHGYDVERLHRGIWSPVSEPASIGGRSHLRARRRHA